MGYEQDIIACCYCYYVYQQKTTNCQKITNDLMKIIIYMHANAV